MHLHHHDKYTRYIISPLKALDMVSAGHAARNELPIAFAKLVHGISQSRVLRICPPAWPGGCHGIV